MLVSFSIAPFDKGESISKYVAEVVNLVDNSGLDYRLGAMNTTVEGEVDELFDLLKQCHLKMREYSNRVVTHIAIDDREGAKNRLLGKPDSIEKRLMKKIKR